MPPLSLINSSIDGQQTSSETLQLQRRRYALLFWTTSLVDSMLGRLMQPQCNCKVICGMRWRKQFQKGLSIVWLSPTLPKPIYNWPASMNISLRVSLYKVRLVAPIYFLLCPHRWSDRCMCLATANVLSCRGFLHSRHVTYHSIRAGTRTDESAQRKDTCIGWSLYSRIGLCILPYASWLRNEFQRCVLSRFCPWTGRRIVSQSDRAR